jgi:agmatinase
MVRKGGYMTPRLQLPDRSFMGFEVRTDPATWEKGIAVIGIGHSEPYAHDPCPNDQTRAPAAIRAQSEQFGFGGGQHFDFEFGAALHGLLPATRFDCGDLTRGPEPYAHYRNAARSHLEQLWRTGSAVFLLGGDHGVSIPAFEALHVLGAPVHIIHIDAHLDWREEVGGIRGGYSSPLYVASGCPWVSGMTQIGLRGTGSARPAEVANARRWGSRMVTAAQFSSMNLSDLIDNIAEDHLIYITIDADGLDPSAMPAVMGPAPGGVTYREVAALIQALGRRHRVVGLDLVELAPSFDYANGLSAITAGRLVLHGMVAASHGFRLQK